MIVINSSTRQFNIPGADMTFGVEADSGSERKHFQCPRYVGNKLDLMSCFVRLNYRNANGEVDSYLVEDMTVDGENVLFSWELSPKVTAYKGQIRFVLCVVGPDTKVAWHTTLGTGVVLEGLEPEYEVIQNGTVDVVAQLIDMVNQQTGAVKAEGANQIKAVQTAVQMAQTAAVAEIEAKGVNVRESIPDDYTSLENTVDSLVRGRAGAIVCSAEGSAVTVNDASDMKMQGIKIFGRSTQNGVPTPDAPVEIVSVEKPVVRVAGKNLLRNNLTLGTVNGVTRTKNADGSITVVGVAETTHGLGVDSGFLLADGEYILTGAESNVITFNIWGRDVNTSEWTTVGTDYGIGCTFKADHTKYSAYLAQYHVPVGLSLNTTLYPMIRHVGVNVDYEPYKSVQTVSTTHTLPGIPVTSGGNYTDSDGQQWISDEVDLERGVYIKRVNSTDLGTLEWTYNPEYDVFLTYVQDIYPNTLNLISTHYQTSRLNSASSPDFTIYGRRSGNQGGLGVKNSNFKDAATFKSAMSGAMALYEIATPVETTLSETEIVAYRAMHTNYPNTTVLNDAGAHMVVKYAADTKLYIDNKIKEVLG